MSNRIEKSFCRLCTGGCGVELTIDDNDSIVDIRGDKQQPMSQGYACFKGLQADEAHHAPHRILRPLKRLPDGTFEEIGTAQALQEIAAKIKEIVDRDGPEAIGLFTGGGSEMNTTARPMHVAFMNALGSPQHYSTLSIDQSAKVVVFERLGGWEAGTHGFDQSEVVMLFGANPLVSHASAGFLTANPTRLMKQAKARGLKIICIDPRRSETARYANLFLQLLPGQDSAVAAGMIRLILEEGWEDKDFCAEHVGADGMARLRAVVDPFTPEMVERRAGLDKGQLRAAVEMFARDSKAGAAFTATGPSMSPFSNLAQHFVTSLNVICGRFRRAGDRLPVDVIGRRQAAHAQVIPPPRSWDQVPPSRIRGVGRLYGEKLTGTLAEEILTPGPGQIKCMVIDGGNVAVNVPDQLNMVKALQSLKLMVTIEPYMTSTAQLSDYILPPLMQYERPDLPMSLGGYEIYQDSWCQYTDPILKPPPGSDLINDWYFFWYVARHLGLSLVYEGKVALDMENPPKSEDLIAIRMQGSPTSLETLKSLPSGGIFDSPFDRVLPARAGATHRFAIMPDDVAEECREFLAMTPADGQTSFTHLLSSRRTRDIFNSNGTKLSKFLDRTPYNPVYINPDDFDGLGIRIGDPVQIRSQHGEVEAIAMADETIRTGVVNLAHGWGGLPGREAEDRGACVNRLIDCDKRYEKVNAMPWMSSIPVSIRKSNGRISQ